MMHRMMQKQGGLTITVRNLPPAVAQRIRDKAAKDGLSLNRAVIALLEESLGLSAKERRARLHHDLDDLAGIWTKEEAVEFDSALREQRKIDEELWQ